MGDTNQEEKLKFIFQKKRTKGKEDKMSYHQEIYATLEAPLHNMFSRYSQKSPSPRQPPYMTFWEK